MFWKYSGYAHISPINSLLDKPDVTVEDILDESDLIEELKLRNTRLIEYFRDDNVLRRLFDIIISPSLINREDENDECDTKNNIPYDDEDASTLHRSLGESEEGRNMQQALDTSAGGAENLEQAEMARLKYAYVASEVLSGPPWSVVEAMVENEEALRSFWQFLWRAGSLDSLQTNYFVKVNDMLLNQKPDDMLAFVMSLDGIAPVLLHHVDNPLIMELLVKLVTMDKPESGLSITEWLCMHNLIPTFLSYLSKDYPSSSQTSAGELLKAIVTVSANSVQNDQPCIGPNSLTRQLVSEPCIQSLISSMIEGGNPLAVGVGIVIDIIRKNNPDYDPEISENRDSPPTIHDSIYLGSMLKAFASHVPQFMEFLDPKSSADLSKSGLDTAWGTKIEPLGFDRFKTCELMAELLHCSNMCLHNEPGSHECMVQRDAERSRILSTVSHQQPEESQFGLVATADGHIHVPPPLDVDSASQAQDESSHSPNLKEKSLFHNTTCSEVTTEGTDGLARSIEADSNFEAMPSANKEPTGSREGFIEQPLTPPSQSNPLDAREGHADDGISVVRPRQLPLSPSASSLTEKVEGFTIDNGVQASPRPEEMTGTHISTESSLAAERKPESTEIEAALPLSSSTIPTSPSSDASPAPKQGSYISLDTDDPRVRRDSNNQPVVGDYLKIMFLENKVVPTIVQLLNGPMDQGFNSALVIDLFETAQITTQIIEAQKRTRESEKNNNMRFGNMGHLTLIAEEVVRFTERHSQEPLPPAIMEKLTHPDWVDYVERTLSENRERESAILGGVKPDMTMTHRQAVLNAINAESNTTGTSSALADAGLNGNILGTTIEDLDFGNQTSVSGGAFGFGTGGSSLFSSFGSSSDDEDEEMEDSQQKRSDYDVSGHGVTNTENVGEDFFEDDSDTDKQKSQPIPIHLPNAPLSMGPSRARRQLAVRLALQKQQAAESEAEKTTISGSHDGSVVPNNPATTKSPASPTENDDPEQNGSGRPILDSSIEHSGTGYRTQPPSFFSSFQSTSGYSSSSSDEDGGDPVESVERKFRLPVDVFDDDDDDDETTDMVGPSTSYSDDDDDETIIREALGYSSFFSSDRSLGDPISSHDGDFIPDSEHQENSDGEDDGFVEILVPGRRPTAG
ncbi:hypothetical protein FQN57_000723 [Myotisia sp. PD_48]|nr:hypothetical protein FQN57_000723 [Myotisia sp. PD_48]